MSTLVQAWRRFSTRPLMLPLTERRIMFKWHRAGRPIPPPQLIKQIIVKGYQRRFRLRVFVETGTFYGDMIDAVRTRFDRIVSIELGADWHARAVQRFAALPHVTLLLGDSGVRLQEVLDTLHEPALFWLDAHYSGPITARGVLDSPIVQELAAIAAHAVTGHVVLIDDMRMFQGRDGYPTIDEVVAWIRHADPAATVEVRDDILRWHPPGA